jgi:hypothetical protein
MNLSETGWEGVDWIRLAQDRDQWQVLLNAVMKNLRITSKVGSFVTSRVIYVFKDSAPSG